MPRARGEWRGGGSGEPGAGKGTFSFTSELHGKAIVRRSRTTYPSITHEDLVVIRRDGDAVRALYVGSEGHEIDYRVEPSEDGVAFLSNGAPRLRLRYRPLDPDRVRVRFEVAGPGGDFGVHVAGEARRPKL